MNMKYLIVWSIVAIGALAACSEDNLTPTGLYQPFAPAADATDEESVLRREFYEKNGFYILFNDTIRKEPVGTNSAGETVYKVETLDPAWQFTGSESNTEYRFAYCQGIDKKTRCADFVTELSEQLTAYNLAKPYSILVVDTLMTVTTSSKGEIVTRYDFLNTFRCFILALPEIKEVDEEEVLMLIANMAGSNLAAKYAGDLEEFFGVSVDYYYGYPLYEQDNEGYNDEEEYYEEGFLQVTWEDLYPSKAQDVSAYLYMVMTMTDEEIRKEFPLKWYPKVIQKYEAILPVILKAGIHLKTTEE